MKYSIRGLDSPSLNCVVSGNMHFVQNVTSDSYRLVEVELVRGVVNLFFEPQETVPNELRKSCPECAVSVYPHKDFSLVIRTVLGHTVKYLVLTCVSVEGQDWPYFHYDILRGDGDVGVDEDTICPDTSYDSLLEMLLKMGFVPTERFDDLGAIVDVTLFDGEIR